MCNFVKVWDNLALQENSKYSRFIDGMNISKNILLLRKYSSIQNQDDHILFVKLYKDNSIFLTEHR
jgi:hypothetical protein